MSRLSGKEMAVGDLLDLGIEKGIYRGLGLARHDGRVILVPRGVGGDRLRVRVESLAPGYARGVVEEILEASTDRRASPCPYAARCGGCCYQHQQYASQLRLKEAILRETLARAGSPWEGEIPLSPSPEEGWRSRASFHVGTQGGELVLGLKEEGHNVVVDLPHCLQISSAMNQAARGILRGLKERQHLGLRVKDAHMAESRSGGRLVAALETDLPPAEAVALGSLMEDAPGLTGLGVLAGKGGRRRYLSLRGEPFVESTVLGRVFRSHVRSFSQVNRFLVEDLVREVDGLLPGEGRLLDLYAGVGLFALCLAQKGDLRAAETSATAVEDFQANARAAGLRVRAFRGDVRDALKAWPGAGARRGLGVETSRKNRLCLLRPSDSRPGPEVLRLVLVPTDKNPGL